MQERKKKIISTLIRKISLITFTLMTIGIFSNISTVAFADTTNWAPVGTPGFSVSFADYTDIAIAPNGTPYVVYMDYGHGQKATVMKYENGSWTLVGSPGFSAGGVQHINIAINSNGTPYVVYTDGGNLDRATVMKYENGAWTTVGNSGFSEGGAYYTHIALDSSGTPYVVFRDKDCYEKATVMKYENGTWTLVGSRGFSSANIYYTDIALDSNGTPYVVYTDWDNSKRVTVMKYDGTNWESVGSPGLSTGSGEYTNIALDSSGTPYVVYKDNVNGNKATVMKYENGDWTTVGSPGFSAGSADYTNIVLDSSGTPYVVCRDNSNKATVMKYENGDWTTVGSPGFSVGTANYTNIAIDSSGTPYVVYKDNGNGNNATVMKLYTYGIDLSQTGTYNFNSQIEGYAQVPAKSITVTKTGDGDITNLGVNLTSGDTNSFNVGTLSTTTINDGTSSATFTIQPKDGLSLGTYTATVTVTSDNSLSESFDVSFTVSSPNDIINVNSIGDINVSNGTDMEDIGLPTSINVTLANLTTTSAAVTWDNGTPEYDGNTAGNYEFKGTLILTNGVTNTNNKYATVNVVVASEGGVTPPPTPPVNPSGPSIRKQPSSQTVRKGNTANFSIEVIGIEPFTYQWQKDGFDLTDSDDISGTNKLKLKIENVSKSDAGEYSCIVTDGNLNVTTSSAATLRVTSKSSSSGSSSSSSSSNNNVSDTVTINSTNSGEAASNSNTYETTLLNALNTKNAKTVILNFDTLANTNKTPVISQSLLAALKANQNKTLIIKTGNSSIEIKSNEYGQVQVTENGVKIIGFKTVGNGDYYLDDNGIMQTGWIKTVDGSWHHFNNNSCARDAGWFQDIDGAKYYLDETTGIMKTDWFKDANNTWYYFDKISGAMKTGWVKDVDGKWYYLYADGSMGADTTIDGYYLDKSGAWIN